MTGLPSGGSRTDTVTHPDLSYSERIYSYGRLTTARDKNSSGGQVTQKTYAYDAYNRLATETDARNGATSISYYDADQVSTVTAPALGTGEPPQVTASSYDTQGRLTGQTLPDGTIINKTYKKTGLLEKTWGSRTYPVEYDYNGQGRMKTMKTWQTYSGGTGTAAITTWNFNAYRGWLDSKDYANATTGAAGTEGPTYTSYTAAGRLASRTWQRGVVTTYEYKVASGSSYTAGDLRLASYSSDPVNTPSTTYTYDRRGRRLTSLRNGITTTYTYNEANRPLSESCSGGTLNNLSVVRTYNSQLRLDTLDAKNGSSFLQRATYTYDTAGRLDQVKDSVATSYYAKYSYEPNSRLVKSLEFTNTTSLGGLLTSRTWDKLNRLTSISSQAYTNQLTVGNPIGFTYQYNQANQRTRADLADGTYWIYQYDTVGQVTSGRHYWADGALMDGQNFEYAFDEIGNRTATGGRASAVSDYHPSGYPVNQLNQYVRRTVSDKVDVFGVANPTAGVTVQKDTDTPLTATRRGEYYHYAMTVGNSSAAQYPSLTAKSLYGATQTIAAGRAFVPPATEIFTYDTDGNLTSDGRWTTYVWDGENRLVEMRRDTATPAEARQKLTFEYDALGRRIRKTYFTWVSAAWAEQRDTIYLYDGWNLAAELNANASNATLRTFVWGNDLTGSREGAGGVGGLLWLNNTQGGLPAGIEFVAYDGNGNVAGIFAAADGANTARYDYGPFGEPMRLTGALAKANPIRWSTKVTDDEGGLVYYGFRYYDPPLGRWINRDPIAEVGGRQVYSFAHNRPISSVDLLGLVEITGPEAAVFSWIERFAPPSDPGEMDEYNSAFSASHPDEPMTAELSTSILNAVIGLADTANPTPGTTLNTSTKETRGWVKMTPTIRCCNGLVSSVKDARVRFNHGYTPIRGGAGVETPFFDPAEGNQPTVIVGPKGMPCVTIVVQHESRVGKAGQAASALMAKSGVPWNARRIVYKLCCNKSYRVKSYGTIFPSHKSYLDGSETGRWDQMDLAEFMFFGGGHIARMVQFSDVESPE